MEWLEFLRQAFAAAFMLDIVYFLWWGSHQKKKSKALKKALVQVEIGYILLFGLLIGNDKSVYQKFILSLVSIIIGLFIFKGIVAVTNCIKTLGDVIESNAKTALTPGERAAVLIVSLLLLLLYGAGFYSKWMHWAIHLENKILSDWMMIACCVVNASVLTFFICSLLVCPIQAFARQLKKLFQGIGRWMEFLIQDDRKFQARTQRYKWWGKLNSIFLENLEIPIYSIVQQVSRALTACVDWVIELSDRRVTALSFRIALLVGLGGTVVSNRYHSFLHQREESTAVLEFAASVLLIPVVWDWITSYRTGKEKQNELDSVSNT